MYEDWLDSVEEKMGARFRFAVEMTVCIVLRCLSVLMISASIVLGILYFAAIFVEGSKYVLPTIFCTIFLVIGLFLACLVFWED